MNRLLADLRQRNVFRIAGVYAIAAWIIMLGATTTRSASCSMSGARTRCRSTSPDAFEDPAYQDPSRMMILAWHAAHFGDDALAGAALRRAFVDMDGTFVPAIWFPQLTRYRKTPEFKELVRDLELVEYRRESGNWGNHCRPIGSDDFECS